MDGREIVMDTETTGLDPAQGHRIVEIGCVEIVDLLPTGRTYHQYINPERSMPQEAFNVHGLGDEFLRDKPLFSDVAMEFVEFVQDSPLVIHNASFDMKFLNFELERIGLDLIPMHQAIDSLAIAQSLYPGAPSNLDALCRRYKIDRSRRVRHGALLDSELLAEVYLNLRGGRQTGLTFASDKPKNKSEARQRIPKDARIFPIAEHEKIKHDQFVDKIEGAIWRR